MSIFAQKQTTYQNITNDKVVSKSINANSAQTIASLPEKMSYQDVVRDASNKTLANQAIGINISILQETTDGSAVYVETQTATSDANGLVSLEIGSGSVVSGDFS